MVVLAGRDEDAEPAAESEPTVIDPLEMLEPVESRDDAAPELIGEPEAPEETSALEGLVDPVERIDAMDEPENCGCPEELEDRKVPDALDPLRIVEVIADLAEPDDIATIDPVDDLTAELLNEFEVERIAD